MACTGNGDLADKDIAYAAVVHTDLLQCLIGKAAPRVCFNDAVARPAAAHTVSVRKELPSIRCANRFHGDRDFKQRRSVQEESVRRERTRQRLQIVQLPEHMNHVVTESVFHRHRLCLFGSKDAACHQLCTFKVDGRTAAAQQRICAVGSVVPVDHIRGIALRRIQPVGIA